MITVSFSRVLTPLVMFSCCLSCMGQTLEVVWQKEHAGRSASLLPGPVAYSESRARIFMGSTECVPGDGASPERFWLLELDQNGEQVRQTFLVQGRTTSRVHSPDGIPSVRLTSAGEALVIVRHSDGHQLIRVKTDGDIRWRAVFSPSRVGTGFLATDVVETYEGHYLLTGQKSSKPCVALVDADGNITDVNVYDWGSGVGLLERIVKLTDNTYCAAGLRLDAPTRYLHVCRMNAQGQILAETSFANPMFGPIGGYELSPLPGGQVAHVYHTGDGLSDALKVKILDSDLHTLHTKTIMNAPEPLLYRYVAQPFGTGLVVLTESVTPNGTLYRLNATGDEVASTTIEAYCDHSDAFLGTGDDRIFVASQGECDGRNVENGKIRLFAVAESQPAP